MKVRTPLIIGVVTLGIAVLISASTLVKAQPSAKAHRLFPGSTRAIFDDCDSMTVYLIHDHGPSTGVTFQGYAVDKQATVTNSINKRLVVSGIYRGIDGPMPNK